MKYWIPGYWEWASKRYVQGVCVFTLTAFAVLYLVKSGFFSAVPDLWERRTGWSLFFLALLWHGFFVVRSSTETTLGGGSIDELYEKARLASLKGNTDMALFYFERLHQKSPQDEDVTYQLGKVYLELGKSREAKKIFRKYLSGAGDKWKREVSELLEEGVSA